MTQSQYDDAEPMTPRRSALALAPIATAASIAAKPVIRKQRQIVVRQRRPLWRRPRVIVLPRDEAVGAS